MEKRRIVLHKDGRLRTTLQILIVTMTFLVFLMLGQMYAGTAIFTLTEKGILPSWVRESYFWSGLLPETILNFIAGGLTILWYRILNRKSLESMGIPSILKNGKTILLGILVVAIMQAGIAGVLLVIGDIRFTGVRFTPSVLQYFLMMSSVSFAEEALNRGYIQHLVKNRSNAFWGCLVSAIVFTLYHLKNPGISLLGLVNIFLVGLCFSLATQKVGNIWFAFGAHLMWNAGSACVFGLMDVSATTGSILNFQYERATLFNGMAQSPLYGLVGTLAWAVLGVVFLVLIVGKRERKSNR